MSYYFFFKEIRILDVQDAHIILLRLCQNVGALPTGLWGTKCIESLRLSSWTVGTLDSSDARCEARRDLVVERRGGRSPSMWNDVLGGAGLTASPFVESCGG